MKNVACSSHPITSSLNRAIFLEVCELSTMCVFRVAKVYVGNQHSLPRMGRSDQTNRVDFPRNTSMSELRTGGIFYPRTGIAQIGWR
jgi:hypothetical protein